MRDWNATSMTGTVLYCAHFLFLLLAARLRNLACLFVAAMLLRLSAIFTFARLP
jgi:hypothetical protein